MHHFALRSCIIKVITNTFLSVLRYLAEHTGYSLSLFKGVSSRYALVVDDTSQEAKNGVTMIRKKCKYIQGLPSERC